MKIFKEYNNINKIFIHKENLYSNLDFLKNLYQYDEIFPVIKSNAYGHGIEEIAMLLAKRSDIHMIAVDSLYEAYILKKLGIKKDVLVMDYTLVDNLKLSL